jgi:hypothetical protein
MNHGPGLLDREVKDGGGQNADGPERHPEGRGVDAFIEALEP